MTCGVRNFAVAIGLIILVAGPVMDYYYSWRVPWWCFALLLVLAAALRFARALRRRRD
jgi:predicted MFS family arabinose efflux permease